jgi:2-haloacid dehalogenase
MKLTDFEVLTFDCYGTLIDWERGILEALAPLNGLRGEPLGANRILEDFAAEEVAQETETPGMIYSEVLINVHQRLARRWEVVAPSGMADSFGGSIADWPAFTDSASSLMYLAKHYKLVILSNVDRAGFAASNRKLQVTFDAVYTAEDIGSYKPDDRNFTYLIEGVARDLGIGKAKILHVAQSLYHDHVPAKKFGLANAWIDRRHDQDGWGATAAPETKPRVDFHFRAMSELVTAHQKALRETRGDAIAPGDPLI